MKKIIFSFVLCLTLLFSYSYCAPNIYALNNFYSGSAVCYAPSNLSGGNYDNNAWVWVTEPTPNTGTANRYKDINVVSSFSDVIMSGTTDVTSVPLIDFDRNIGKRLLLPSGTCAVIYSSSFNDYSSTANIQYSKLGYHKPQPTGGVSDRLVASVTSAGVGSISLKSATDEFIAGEQGAYIFLYNNQSSEVYVQVADYTSTGLVEVTPTPIADVHWVINTFKLGSSTSVVYAMPHIKGVADIYVSVASNSAINQDTTISLRSSYGNTFTSVTTAGVIKTAWQLSLIMDVDCRFTETDISVSYSSSSGGSGYYNYDYSSYNGCPTFLNNTIYLFPYSVNLNNVQQLAKAIADALSSSGGGGDYNALLRQILSELQLANTGGPLGDTVRQGMQALEQAHQSIIDNADFTGFSDAIDDYKSLVDFSSDMHWLIRANNTLFSYFSGFIILCCLLLTIGRILR